MNNEKLNNLVDEYQKTRNEDIFNEIYNELLSGIQKSIEFSSKRQGITPEDMIEIYEDNLLKAIEIYKGSGNFRKLFNSMVIRRRIDASRKQKTVRKYEYYYEELSQSLENPDAATFEIPSDFDLENEVIQTKEADQRQLIDFLLKDSDETTTAIVESYLTLPKPSPLSVEKYTGICRKKVKRKLEKLAGKFDSKQFGDYSDYLVAL